MPFTVVLPDVAGDRQERRIDIVDGTSTAVQRSLRREGVAGYEPSTMAALLALFEIQQPGFTFFDVGANIGLYAVICETLFEPSLVVGFEPTPDTARIARKIGRVNQLDLIIEELALGAETGTAELFLSAKSDASNSLVEGFKENVGTVTIEVETLDSYVDRTGRVPDIVKIDTETFEPEVLAGAKETLRTHQPALIVEVLHRKGHDHGVEMMDAMKDLGYLYHDVMPYSEFSPVPTISGDPSGEERDWLLTSQPLPPDFIRRFETWQQAIARCTPDRNGLPPMTALSDAARESELVPDAVQDAARRVRAFGRNLARRRKR